MFGLVPLKEKERFGVPALSLRDEFKTLYDRLFGGFPMMIEPVMEAPPVWGLEVKDYEKEVVVWAEIPGFEVTDLHVELKNYRLILKAEKKIEKKENGKEFAARRYERALEIPVEIEPAKIVATYRNGVLEIHLPKKEEVKALHIPVT
jgi:HSP20 family protein